MPRSAISGFGCRSGGKPVVMQPAAELDAKVARCRLASNTVLFGEVASPRFRQSRRAAHEQAQRVGMPVIRRPRRKLTPLVPAGGPGLGLELGGEPRPLIGGQPCSALIMGRAVALALHPDEREVAVRRQNATSPSSSNATPNAARASPYAMPNRPARRRLRSHRSAPSRPLHVPAADHRPRSSDR